MAFKLDQFRKQLDSSVKLEKSKGGTYEQILFGMSHQIERNTQMANMISVEVKPSPIHGRGVFATRKIFKDDVITVYPCHKIVSTIGANDHIMYRVGIRVPPHDDYMAYAQCISESDAGLKYISADPSQPALPHICAHLINDPYPNAPHPKLHYTDPQQCGKAFIEYHLLTNKYGNSIIRTYRYYALAIATRDIEAGEEILGAYGFPYWTQNKMDEISHMLQQYYTTLTDNQMAFVTKIIKEGL